MVIETPTAAGPAWLTINLIILSNFYFFNLPQKKKAFPKIIKPNSSPSKLRKILIVMSKPQVEGLKFKICLKLKTSALRRRHGAHPRSKKE